MSSVLETAKENLAYGVDTITGKFVAYIIDIGSEEDYLWYEEFDTFLDAQYALSWQVGITLERPIKKHFQSIRERIILKTAPFEVCIGVGEDK